MYVKSNGQLLGEGNFAQVTFAQTENGEMWAIKEPLKIHLHSK
ncbi:hypothetical protein K661_02789 [Piscirickettsia salmonis LF-89 = ATCC VR-1361]|nr:hypothetical protein K661_02789 [Piscirickettsia salmonis LF-89 = ATCC VR-1361]